ARRVHGVLALLSPPRVADDALEVPVGRAGTHGGEQIGLVSGEETGPKLSVRGQADPVAIGAERLRYRVDEPDPPLAVHEAEHPRGRVRLARNLLERVNGLDHRPDLATGEHGVGGPRAVPVERHEL